MTPATPLVPRDPSGDLVVIVPGRISTPSQDPESIGSQQHDTEGWLGRNHPGPTRVHRFGDQASGWLADRAAIARINAMVEARECDLVLVSEMREVFRNPEFQWRFVFNCLDHDVRFISVADGIDTADENWQTMMHTASLVHGIAVPQTRMRVRRMATHTFARGGMVQKYKFGYRKLTEGDAAGGAFGPVGLRIARVPECTPVVRELRRRIVAGESYVALADDLNDRGVGVGPYVQGGRWTGRVVRDLMGDPILSGRRRFRTTITQLVYKTGKHRTRVNPAGPDVKEYPELAHLTVEEQDELVAVMHARRDEYRDRQRCGTLSPPSRRPRSRSLWPGQQATCGACGGRMYRYGEFLRCKNTLSAGRRSCWNHVQVRIAAVRAKVLPWVAGQLDRFPGARAAVARAAWHEFQRARRRHQKSSGPLDARIAELGDQATRLAKAVAAGGPMDELLSEMKSVKASLADARAERARLTDAQDAAPGFGSEADVLARLDEALGRMAERSSELADILRRLLPAFVVQPVQRLDCPQVLAVAKLTLRLDAWAGPEEPAYEASAAIELFDPPLPIRHLSAVLAARAARPGASLKAVAAELGIGHMTVKRAGDYARLMAAEGLAVPYRELHATPPTASRWRKRKPPEAEPPPT